VENFRTSKNWLGYLYKLTPHGIARKAALTGRFLRRKMAKYEALGTEIEAVSSEAGARRVLRDLERACPLRIPRNLIGSGKEFTDRLFGTGKLASTGKHDFDLLCAELGIAHRLPRRSIPRPTEWSNASTDGSRRCYKATISIPPRVWKLR
jgi:hypothetical protein